jgi:2-methylisocitrate lyase-like PEP mutase family enzyme
MATLWARCLDKEAPLLLPAAHDGLTARLIGTTGFTAYQIGGFALEAARFGLPDIGLVQLGEKAAAVRDISASSELPVLVDADDGYGDPKSIVRTVETYCRIPRVAALFFEDQQAPKSCGQEGNKQVIPTAAMVAKIKAAVEARAGRDLFLMARTDARSAEGLLPALNRATEYALAGADGIYIEGLESLEEHQQAAGFLRSLKVPLATTLMEGGGKLPWVSPQELGDAGFSMVLYPTTVLLPVAWAAESALKRLRRRKPMSAGTSMEREQLETVLDMERWQRLEKSF